MTSRVEVVDIGKRYDGILALEHVRISAQPNEVTSIVGTNGAGKTTLLKILAGLETSDTGRVLIDGREVDQNELRSRCTMVFQKTVIFGTTVYGNVAYGLEVKSIPRQEIGRRVKSALHRVNLEGFEKRKARKLSGGEQQRVSLARALVLERDLLLIDEPTANLDPANALLIEQAITEAKSMTTIILSTHNLPQARRLSDHVVHLHRGRVIEEGPASSFFTAPQDERTRLFINGELQY
jgi:tungstate transport system ATP-binding protein